MDLIMDFITYTFYGFLAIIALIVVVVSLGALTDKFNNRKKPHEEK